MYQSYLGASLYEYIRDEKERLKRKRDDEEEEVTDRETILHLLPDDVEEEVRERDENRARW